LVREQISPSRWGIGKIELYILGIRTQVVEKKKALVY